MSRIQSSMTPAQLMTAIDPLPRFSLAQLPTPLEFLPRFTQVIGGPRIYIKRDDCTGLAFGGNKTRHNEFLVADALSKQADMIVWGAGVQSNNCRQTAAACAKAGLDCHLVLGRGNDSTEPPPVQGNLLLDHLLGAIIEIVEPPVGPELEDLITAKAETYRARGRKVYAWDRETVRPLAAISYAICAAELATQTEQLGFTPDAVYVSSAGSTGSGLALGKAALGKSYPLRNIAPIDWPWDTQADMTRIANQAAELIGLDPCIGESDIDVTMDFIGPGYGKSSCGGLEALALLARTEGILLDPAYTGKAMAALIDHARKGMLTSDQHVVFIHTGGTPALFAYHDDLSSRIAGRQGSGQN